MSEGGRNPGQDEPASVWLMKGEASVHFEKWLLGGDWADVNYNPLRHEQILRRPSDSY
jgi:hypothetical protein